MDPCSLHLGRTQHWASQRNNQSSGVIDCPSCPFIHQFVHLLIDCKIRQRKKPDLGNAAGTWGHWRQYVDLSWTPLWLNFAETGFNPQAADVSCFYFPGVNSSHSFFILLDILHHDRFSRSLDSWRKLIFNALSEAFMADHRTYTICSGFRTGSLPACWKMYHSRQSGCFMVARYGQVSWSRFGGLNMPEYLYIYSLLRRVQEHHTSSGSLCTPTVAVVTCFSLWPRAAHRVCLLGAYFEAVHTWTCERYDHQRGIGAYGPNVREHGEWSGLSGHRVPQKSPKG